jgi:hypothetical protein
MGYELFFKQFVCVCLSPTLIRFFSLTIFFISEYFHFNYIFI